jgi:SAM-dependent methyltransferase
MSRPAHSTPTQSTRRAATLSALAEPLAPESPERPFRSYVSPDIDVRWSAELEKLHLSGTRDHWIDAWTREAALTALAPETLHPAPVIADLGCSSGHLLADLAARVPAATLIGLDAVPDGLARAAVVAPDSILCHASVTELPIADASIDGIVALNLLEHVPDDERALREMARVLAPSGRAAIVVPRGPELYDIYDQTLQHERRYASGELSRKAIAAGLTVRDRISLGSVVFPGFWLVKKRNRRRHAGLTPAEAEALVASSITSTQDSRIGELATATERRLVARGVRLPFGIRELLVVERP